MGIVVGGLHCHVWFSLIPLPLVCSVTHLLLLHQSASSPLAKATATAGNGTTHLISPHIQLKRQSVKRDFCILIPSNIYNGAWSLPHVHVCAVHKYVSISAMVWLRDAAAQTKRLCPLCIGRKQMVWRNAANAQVVYLWSGIMRSISQRYRPWSAQRDVCAEMRPSGEGVSGVGTAQQRSP